MGLALEEYCSFSRDLFKDLDFIIVFNRTVVPTEKLPFQISKCHLIQLGITYFGGF